MFVLLSLNFDKRSARNLTLEFRGQISECWYCHEGHQHVSAPYLLLFAQEEPPFTLVVARANVLNDGLPGDTVVPLCRGSLQPRRAE